MEMDQGQSTTSESERMDQEILHSSSESEESVNALLKDGKNSYEILPSSESEESSSGERGYYDDELYRAIKKDEYLEDDDPPPASSLICDIGKISRVFRYPNNKIQDFYPGCITYIAREKVTKFHNSYLKVLIRCWQIDANSIVKEDLKLIKTRLNPTTRIGAVAVLRMLALYTFRYKIPPDVYHSAFELLPLLRAKDKKLLVILSSNFSNDYISSTKHVKRYQETLKSLLKRVPFEEASLKIAIFLGLELGEYRIKGLLEKDFNLYLLAVLDYYKKFDQGKVPIVISKWITSLLDHPEKIKEVNFRLVEPLKVIVKDDLVSQKKVLQLILCQSSDFDSKKWINLLNPEIFDQECRRLQSLLVKNPENSNFISLDGETFSTEERILLDDEELNTLNSIIYEHGIPGLEFTVKYEGKDMKFSFYGYISYGMLIEVMTEGKNAGTPLYIESSQGIYANEKSVYRKDWPFEIKEGYPADNKIPLTPVSPQLEIFLKKPPSTIVKRFLNCRLSWCLFKILGSDYHEKINGQWNYMILNYPHLFNLKNRFLWFKSILCYERCKEKYLMGKQFIIKRESLFEQGLEILRRDIASYWVQLRFVFEGDSKVGTVSTREFYSEYSRELIKRLINETSDVCGWKDLGYLIARCILDQHYINLSQVLYLFSEETFNPIAGNEAKETLIKESETRISLIEEGIEEFFRSNPFIFQLDEIPMLIGNNPKQSITWVPAYGYHDFSDQFLWMIEIFDAFDTEHQSSFFQFVSGGQFLAPRTRITVVPLKGNDETLPMAITCSNYLKLPRYSSEEVLRSKLLYALKEGLTGFYAPLKKKSGYTFRTPRIIYY